jgi:hypothetical protein
MGKCERRESIPACRDHLGIQTRARARTILMAYYRDRLDWRRFRCQLPDGRLLLVGEVFGSDRR